MWLALAFGLVFSCSPEKDFSVSLTPLPEKDTVINAIQLKRDEPLNTWILSWNRPVESLRVRVVKVNGKTTDQTFGKSENGEWRLLQLTPGFYIISVSVNNELPFRVHLVQAGFCLPPTEE